MAWACAVQMAGGKTITARLVKSAGLSIEDRVLGTVFGLARGVLIVMVFVLMAGMTSLPRQPMMLISVRNWLRSSEARL